MKFYFVLSVLLILGSCSSGKIRREIDVVGLKIKFPDDISQEKKLYSFSEGEIQGSIRRFSFSDVREARTYAMERRMLILREFETLIEPYFGTVNAKECGSNLKSEILIHSNQILHAVMQLPTTGPERTIHDCLVENNTDWGHIEFLVCGKNFYDIRLFKSIKQRSLSYQPYFKCRG